MNKPNPQRRKGTGSVYQRRQDGLWMVAVSASAPGEPRKRRVLCAASEEDARAKLEELVGATDQSPRVTRTELEARARKLGTHTVAELTAKLVATTTCRYCKTHLNGFNRVADHIVPLVKNGSDALDNLQGICWECNDAKRDKLDYQYAGSAPRVFSPLPSRRRSLERFLTAYQLDDERRVAAWCSVAFRVR